MPFYATVLRDEVPLVDEPVLGYGAAEEEEEYYEEDWEAVNGTRRNRRRARGRGGRPGETIMHFGGDVAEQWWEEVLAGVCVDSAVGFWELRA